MPPLRVIGVWEIGIKKGLLTIIFTIQNSIGIMAAVLCGIILWALIIQRLLEIVRLVLEWVIRGELKLDALGALRILRKPPCGHAK